MKACQGYLATVGYSNWLRLFSHDGKVRILNFNSKCAFWITQCSHERSNCDIWITECTHERPNLGFCIPAGELMSGYPANQTCMELAFPVLLYIYAARGIYMWKWLEGHLAPPPPPPPPNHDLEVRAFIRWFSCDVIWRTHGPKYRLSNFNSKCAFRIKIQNTHFAAVWKLVCSRTCVGLDTCTQHLQHCSETYVHFMIISLCSHTCMWGQYVNQF